MLLKHEDSLLYLQDTETLLRSIKPDDTYVTQLLLQGVIRRNKRLIKEAEEGKENYIKKKKIAELEKQQALNEPTFPKKILILGTTFAVGFTAAHFALKNI